MSGNAKFKAIIAEGYKEPEPHSNSIDFTNFEDQSDILQDDLKLNISEEMHDSATALFTFPLFQDHEYNLSTWDKDDVSDVTAAVDDADDNTHDLSSGCTFAKAVLSKRQKVLMIYCAIVMILSGIFCTGILMTCFDIFCNCVFFTLTLHKLYLFHLGTGIRRKCANLTKDSDANTHNAELDEFMSQNTLPRYSIMVPMYKECEEIVHNLISNVAEIIYDKSMLQVMIVLEEVDKETIAIVEKMVLPQYFTVIVVPAGKPQTKGRACNYALPFASGDYLVIYDAEDRPERYQLLKAVKAFGHYNDGVYERAESNLKPVVCVQARLNFYNRCESMIASIFSIEYYTQFDYLLETMSKYNLLIPLGGTSNHFDMQFLRDIGGWDPYNVTEDADIGMRIAIFGCRVGMIDSYTMEEAPLGIISWLKQRTRWMKGHMQTFLVYHRWFNKTFKRIGLLSYINFVCLLGLGPFSHLLMIPSVISLLFSCNASASSFTFSVDMLFFAGNVVFWYVVLIYTLAFLRPRLNLKVTVILCTPFYFLMHVVASIRAITQLVMNPHYWSKTAHGKSILFRSGNKKS